MGNRCSIQQGEENNCWLEQSPAKSTVSTVPLFLGHQVYFFFACLLVKICCRTPMGNFDDTGIIEDRRYQGIFMFEFMTETISSSFFYFLYNFSLGQFPNMELELELEFPINGIDVIVVVAFISYWIVIFPGRSIYSSLFLTGCLCALNYISKLDHLI